MLQETVHFENLFIFPLIVHSVVLFSNMNTYQSWQLDLFTRNPLEFQSQNKDNVGISFFCNKIKVNSQNKKNIFSITS